MSHDVGTRNEKQGSSDDPVEDGEDPAPDSFPDDGGPDGINEARNWLGDLEFDGNADPYESRPNTKDYLAAAVRNEDVARRVFTGLDPHARSLIYPERELEWIAERLDEHVREHGTVPNDADWNLYIEDSSWPDERRRVLARELGNVLYERDLPWSPEVLAEKAPDVLEAHAKRTATLRLQQQENVELEDVRRMLERAESIGTEERGSETVNLAEMLENGPPPIPLPKLGKLAWPGTISMLAAREKVGKTEFAVAAMTAAEAGRPFLGETPPRHGAGILYCYEDPDFLMFRRFSWYGPDTGANVEGLKIPHPDPVTAIRDNIEKHDPDVLVIDPLEKYAQSFETRYNGTPNWSRVMTSLRSLVNEYTDLAVLIIHHRAKNSSEMYRDHTTIGASVDMILTMEAPAEDPKETPVREVETRGRFDLQDYRVVRCRKTTPMGQDRQGYRLLEGGELEAVKVRVENAVRTAEEPLSKRGVRKAVDVDNTDVDEAVDQMLESGRLVDANPDGQALKLDVPGVGASDGG